MSINKISREKKTQIPARGRCNRFSSVGFLSLGGSRGRFVWSRGSERDGGVE